ncbi:hypothetical protein, partial [Saliniramus sp.]|uniref:hypothetical protein n=1 Tax=Saliniramus sp. TaxID=2986772 RepID=UPI002C766F59
MRLSRQVFSAKPVRRSIGMLVWVLFDIVGKEERETWSALSLRVLGALFGCLVLIGIVSDSTFLSGSHQFCMGVVRRLYGLYGFPLIRLSSAWIDLFNLR